MAGTKQAQKVCCARCQHFRNTGAWSWPRCCYRDITGVNDDLCPDIDDAFLNGPTSNCLAGRWQPLDPIGPADSDEYDAWRMERAHEHLRNKLKLRLKTLLEERATDDERGLALVVLTEFGALPHWLAHEVAKEFLIEHAPTDGPT